MADTGTAVAKKKDRTEEIFDKLSKPGDTFEVRRQAYALATDQRKDEMLQRARYAVASTTWGKQLPNERAQAAMAEWALSQGIDFVRHLDILGGNPYLNAEYYMDRLRSHRDYFHADWIVIAPYSRQPIPEDVFTSSKMRGKLANDEERDNAKIHALQRKCRLPERFNDPKYKETCAVVLAFVTMRSFKSDGSPCEVTFSDFNTAGSCGRKSKRGGPTDPVGDDNPVSTAKTRAFRKTCWQVPGMSPKLIEAEVGLEEIKQTIQGERTEGTRHNTLIKEIEQMLGMKLIPKDTRAYCQSIYDDWVAGAFQNVTVSQLMQLRDELDGGLQDVEGLRDVDVIEDVVDGVTGEVIEENGVPVKIDEDKMLDAETGAVILDAETALCPECNASLDMGEPHDRECLFAPEDDGTMEPEMDEDDARERVERQRELDMLRKENPEQ